MFRSHHLLSAAVVATALATSAPTGALARSVASSCPPATTHALPKGSKTTAVFTFGVKGGSLRPWSVTLALGGSVAASGATPSRQTLSDPKNTLKALLALADAQGFFTLKRTVGCGTSAGNPDVSSRFITVHTSSGTKTVTEFGSSCAATAHYDGLYDLLQAMAGIGS